MVAPSPSKRRLSSPIVFSQRSKHGDTNVDTALGNSMVEGFDQFISPLRRIHRDGTEDECPATQPTMPFGDESDEPKLKPTSSITTLEVVPLPNDRTSRIDQVSLLQPQPQGDHWEAECLALVRHLIQIGDVLNRYCQLRARHGITGISCLRIQKQLKELKVVAESKNELLQHTLSVRIAEFYEEDTILSRQLTLLREISVAIESLHELVECASTVKCAEYIDRIEMIKTQFSPMAQRSDQTMLSLIQPEWNDRDFAMDRHLQVVSAGVDSLENIAINIRNRNNELGEVIRNNQQGLVSCTHELDYLLGRMRVVQKLLKHSRFWCYLSLMMIIVMLSASLGFLLKTTFGSSGSVTFLDSGGGDYGAGDGMSHDLVKDDVQLPVV